MRKLPPNWLEAKVPDLADVLDSRRIPLNASERAARKGPFPYYGANGLVDQVDAYLFEGEHSLLAEDGGHFFERHRGVAYTVDGRFWVNNHAHILKPCGGIPTEFLTAWLNAIDWRPHVGGTTRAKLTQGGLGQPDFPLPPLAEQRRIVAKLDALTARTARARADLDRVPVLAEAYRRAVLAAAFSGELTRHWRTGVSDEASPEAELETARRQKSQLLGVPPRKYAPPITPNWTPNASLPKGWRWVSVDQIVTVAQYGTSAKTAEVGDVPVLRMGNIVDGEIDLASLKYLPTSHKEFPQLLLEEGDVLFNRTNSAELVGKSAVYRGENGPTSFASYLIRLKTVGYIPELLAAYINSPWGRSWVAASITQQVGQANLNGTKLRGLAVPFMSEGEQAAIWSSIRNAFAEIDRIVTEAAAARRLLDRLDQAILAKAFRGELVPQDPNDEPASVLLDRIRAERATQGAPKRGRGRRPAEAAA